MYGYILLATLWTTTIFSLLMWVRSRHESFHLWDLLTGISATIFFVALIAVAIERFQIHGTIAAHEATRTSVLESRSQNLDPMERAAIQQTIAAANRDLARLQFNYRYWKPFVPAAVLDVEPIR